MKRRPLHRRWLALGALIVGVAVLAIAVAGRGTSPEREADVTRDGQQVVVYRAPTCSCCSEYETYLRQERFAVRAELVDDMAAVKVRYGIPGDAVSCHTALVGGYVVEGHVPAAAIDRLLTVRPAIDGIALPGMPPGSPGMGGDREGPLEIVSLEDGVIEPYMTL